MTWTASDSDQPDLDTSTSLDDASPLERAEITDSDDLGSTDAGLDPLDDSWDPPDRPSPLLRNQRTPREERGSSFDRQLAAEMPDVDPYAEAERNGSAPSPDGDFYQDEPVAESAFDDLGTGVSGEARTGVRGEPARRDGESWRRSAEEDALHLDPRS